VVGGWFFGGLVLLAWLRYESAGERWVRKLCLTRRIVLTIVATLAIVAGTFLAQYLAVGWAGDPGRWFRQTERGVAYAGLMLGAGTGLAVSTRYIRYSTRAPWWQHLIRLGIFGIGWKVINKGIMHFLPKSDEPLRLFLQFFEKLAIAWWLTVLAPLLYLAIGLAVRRESEESVQSESDR
jgi:hypothetical protein